MTEYIDHRCIRDYKIVRDYEVPYYSADGYEPVGGAVITEDSCYQAMAYYEPVQRIITKKETPDD